MLLFGSGSKIDSWNFEKFPLQNKQFCFSFLQLRIYFVDATFFF